MKKFCSQVIKAFVVCLFLSNCLYCAEALDLRKFVHRSWNNSNGLPQNSVKVIIQDNDGYLWLATQEGIVRFDGVSFKVFNKSNEPAITSNFILSIFKDSTGKLWFGTESGLITRYNGIFSRAGFPELSNSRILSIFESADGSMYFSAAEKLAKLKDGKLTVYDEKNGFPGELIYTIAESSEGSILVGTKKNIMSMKDGRSIKIDLPPQAEGNAIMKIFRDSRNTIWLGTSNGGIVSWAGGVFKVYGAASGPANSMVYDIMEDSEGNIWAAVYGGGINMISAGRITAYSKSDGFGSNEVRSIFQDREKNLWFGTENSGIHMFRKAAFGNIGMAEGLPGDDIRSMLQDSAGNIWLGTTSTGLARIDTQGRITVFTEKDGLSSNKVRALFEDRSGRIWIGTYYAGLNLYENGKITRPVEFQPLSGSSTRVIYQARNGTIWFGTIAGGLFSFIDGKFTHYGKAEGVAGLTYTDIVEDNSGAIWFGSWNEGITVFRDGKFSTVNKKDGLCGSMVLSLMADASGNIWAGTFGDGLCIYKNSKFLRVPEKAGFASDTVAALLPDGLGSVWMSDNKGVFKASMQELLDSAEGKLDTLTSWRRFDTADGMNSAETNGGSQRNAIRLKDKRLMFATIGGAAYIDPEKLNNYAGPVPVVIEQMLAEKEAVDITKDIVLKKNVKNLEIRYTGLSMIASERITFKYMLEGYDRDWVEAGTRRTAFYTNLDPGTYRFIVTARNSDGILNTSNTGLTFIKQPYIYQTLLFKILFAFILFAMIGIALFVFYRRRIEYLEREKLILEKRAVEAEKKYEKARLDDDRSKLYLEEFLKYFDEKQPWKDPLITMQKISDSLGISNLYLSQVINRFLNQSFNTLINNYRIAEVKKRLEDPAFKDENVIVTAFDCGFNSKATFNAAFKKNTGLTPTEYRKKHLKTEISEENQ